MIIKIKQLRLAFFLVILSSYFSGAFAQNSLGDKPSEQKAFEFFQEKNYYGCINLLRDKTSLSTDEEILYQISRLKTGYEESENILTWIKDHPNHPLKSLAQFHYGVHQFYQNDSIASRKILSQVKSRELSKENQANYGFIYGLLNLQSKQYKNAGNLFALAEKNGFEDKDQLLYYQSFTKYHLSNPSQALVGFESLQDSPEYGLSSRFFVAKIWLDSDRSKEVISLAQSEISDEISITNSGFHQLIGEAYALEGDLTKADAYFEQAIKKHPGRPTSALFYQAGVSKFKIGNEEKAIEYLRESGIGAGEYAKLSAFQLGRLYVKRKDFENALVAYTEAASSDDAQIKEESLYQVANLNAQLKRYTESINYADDYLDAFKSGRWRTEMQNLIAESYLRTSNYDLAIEHLEKLGVNNATQREVFQKVSLQKGVQLFNDGDFKNAKAWFQKSLNYPALAALANESYYYIGEILSREGQYNQAITSYKKQTSLNPTTHYGIGYAYYNLQQYQSAIEHFRKAQVISDVQMSRDATLRLADCQYATKSYQDALTNYQKLPANDYVNFQMALVFRNLDRPADAKQALNKITRKSSYADDGQFLLAQIDFESADFEVAERSFTQLIESHNGSEYLVKAYLNRAISRNNLQKLDLAKQDYEHVLNEYIEREESFSAILGLQEFQQKGLKVNGLDQYIAAYKRTNPDGNNLELVEFESAKGSYFAFNYDESAAKMDAFLTSYPESKYRVEASYYLGDSYYRSNKLENAKMVFDKMRLQQTVYTGRVLSRLGEINEVLGNYESAIESYKLLLKLNLSPKDNYIAREGLVSIYYKTDNFIEAIDVADQIITGEWKPMNANEKAKITKARSLFMQGKLDEAATVYEELSKLDDVIGAESNYQLAWIAYNKDAFDQSLNLLFDLNKKYGMYGKWIDQSYLLIADNYIGLGELFQAKATLRSIIEHSKSEEVRSIANQRLKSIENGLELDTVQTGNN